MRLKAIVMGFALLLLLASVGCLYSHSRSIPSPAVPAESQVIVVEGVEGEENGSFLWYNQELYWDEEQFNEEYEKYSTDKAGYLKNFVESLSEGWSSHRVEATDWTISFRSKYELATDVATYSALIRCRVSGSGAVSEGAHPTFIFNWLLEPMGFDLYALEYTPDRTALVWEGELGHIPTTITLRFPWPIGHCHYHIWYRG